MSESWRLGFTQLLTPSWLRPIIPGFCIHLWWWDCNSLLSTSPNDSSHKQISSTLKIHSLPSHVSKLPSFGINCSSTHLIWRILISFVINFRKGHVRSRGMGRLRIVPVNGNANSIRRELENGENFIENHVTLKYFSLNGNWERCFSVCLFYYFLLLRIYPRNIKENVKMEEKVREEQQNIRINV